MHRKSASYSDEEFIDALRSGDSEVLTILYKKHYQAVLRFIVNNSGSEEAARDVYQEAVIVLYENSQDPAFTLHCKMQTYLYSVAKRIWLKQLRKSGKTFMFSENEEDEIADVTHDMNQHLQREEDISKMTQSLQELGEPCSTLLKDFYIMKMSMDEIADKFGYTNADNAKTQKYKCLQRLKRQFYGKGMVEQQ